MIAIMARISLDEREVWTSIIDGWGAVLMRPIPREITGRLQALGQTVKSTCNLFAMAMAPAILREQRGLTATRAP